MLVKPTRYKNDKFWKMVESDEGQYISYHEYESNNKLLEDEIERLKTENERFRKDLVIMWHHTAHRYRHLQNLIKNKKSVDKYANKNRQLAITVMVLLTLLILHIVL